MPRYERDGAVIERIKPLSPAEVDAAFAELRADSDRRRAHVPRPEKLTEEQRRGLDVLKARFAEPWS